MTVENIPAVATPQCLISDTETVSDATKRQNVFAPLNTA